MKKAFFFIDDVIWVLRDLTRMNPKSIFDVPYFKALKNTHDRYGAKVQLNLFYRTDFFYGDDEFTLAEVPDKYKAEFEANSDWLRFAFHAKQEFPDYPYVNISYEDMDKNFKAIYNEVCRFAGEKSFSYQTVSHWLPVSREGVQALYDNGVRMMMSSHGEKTEYNGDPSILPYGHAGRLLQNKKPETALFSRINAGESIENSICGYNHISQEDADSIMYNQGYVVDEGTGMKYKITGHCALNLINLSELPEVLGEFMQGDYVGIGDHEQYFYSDYFAYQPDHAEKFYLMGKVISEAGYTFVNGDELE